ELRRVPTPRPGPRLITEVDEGPDAVRGQVGAAAVERQSAPAPAEGRPTAVAILQSQQPVPGVPPALPGLLRWDAEGTPQVAQGDDRPRRVVRVRHRTRQRRPGKPTGGRPREGVPVFILLALQPAIYFGQPVQIAQLPGSGQGVDRQGRDPG